MGSLIYSKTWIVTVLSTAYSLLFRLFLPTFLWIGCLNKPPWITNVLRAINAPKGRQENIFLQALCTNFQCPRPYFATNSPLYPYISVHVSVSWFPRRRNTCCGKANFKQHNRVSVSRPQAPLSTKSPLKTYIRSCEGHPPTSNLQWLVLCSKGCWKPASKGLVYTFLKVLIDVQVADVVELSMGVSNHDDCGLWIRRCHL